ncbi:MAG: mannose-1-phosphate guanylyltransferase/mannose-6-phosphate isomerase [Rickettsiales bacterium]|nr:mannose-1-phosphate guanylyltransferase/mannose-6-phosphate isomerase [Rickettsiales bacterium]
MKICPVILCGGIGSRLWPASQNSLPKQFLKFNSKYSLLQNTIFRISDTEVFSTPLIICSEKSKFRTASALEELNISPLSIIAEPEQKNTAPAITLAAMFLKKFHPELQQMLVLASDHLIEDEENFVDYIQTLKQSNPDNLIVTFGIKPTHPATGYGYINQGAEIQHNLFHVNNFIEKPLESTAKKLIQNNRNLWNSGIFFVSYNTLLSEIKLHKPSIYQHISDALEKSKKDDYFLNIPTKSDFSKCENISIDYAILEKTENIAVFPLDIKWNDLGTWQSIYNITKKDPNNNAILGKKIYPYKTQDCLIYSDNPRVSTVTHRVTDLNISITDNVILISNKQYPEEIKEVYNALKDVSDIKEPSLEYRPWGYYKNILTTTDYKVKLLSINPNSQISLQYHHRRAEHWVITKGVATITIGQTIHTLNRDQSIYVPQNEIHRIENKTLEVLEIIEVQVGEYLGEDDIVRLEDKYNRI